MDFVVSVLTEIATRAQTACVKVFLECLKRHSIERAAVFFEKASVLYAPLQKKMKDNVDKSKSGF